MSTASISKIHVTNSTGLSLNERFTAITKPDPPQLRTPVVRRRSRSLSRSLPRKHTASPVERISSLANRRLLDQLARKHKLQAALKLKRRSMKTAGAAHVRRGTVKALRVAPNGRPIRTNTLTKVATMKADYIANGNGGGRRPLRRSNSSSNLAGRLGSRRPSVGGAAQRVARRHQERSHSGRRGAGRIIDLRGRSRSRSGVRGRSISRGRSASRGRGNINNGLAAQSNRGRPRSRSRVRDNRSRAALPIQARLGVRRAGGVTATGNAERPRRRPRGGVKNRRRIASIGGRGVAEGRVEKRRNNSTAPGGQRAGQRREPVQRAKAAGAGGRIGRGRARSSTRVDGGAARSRSRTRKGSVGQKQLQQQRSGASSDRGGRRGRSQQRNGGRRGGIGQRNGNAKGGTTGRGRSRSRGVRGGRNLGNSTKPQVNKDALDQELDQYMATTKTENDMDYLLKN